jgi:membrane protease YdiL (CAAX protease family)
MVPTFIDHILVLVFGLVLPFFSGIRGSEQLGNIYFDERTRRKFFISNSLLLWFMTAIVMLIWYLYDRPFSLMGFRKVEHGWIPWVLTLVMLAAYAADILYSLFSPEEFKKTQEQWENSVPFLPEEYRELRAYTFMCITAGVCEEILFRGFMVTYFIDPLQTGFHWMAAIFPAILFSLAHYYQGYKAMLKIFLLSLLFALIFIYSKSLLIIIVIHFLIDFIGGIAAIRMKKKELFQDN